MDKKKIIVIGAGPAGLTAAYELAKNPSYLVTVLEETNAIGGISRTVNYKGNRMDMGGHRFFSKDKRVNSWWASFMKDQGKPSKDDIILKRDAILAEGGPDPEVEDEVMLVRNRISRIYFNKHFFDYPITMKFDTFRNMGLQKTIVVICSYLKSVLIRREENNLENFYINRFGRKLYSMFFEYYTENLWGRHPREIAADWGRQRAKGLSITAVVKDVLSQMFHTKNNKNTETSLIESFRYPKYGPGQLWEKVALECEKGAVCIRKGCKVLEVEKSDVVGEERVSGVIYEDQEGARQRVEADIIMSSMAVKELIAGMKDVPSEVARVANGLPYRSYVTVGILVPRMALKNNSKVPTLGDYIPDNWVYVQDHEVRLGRFQIFNNWSPYMVKDPVNTCWIGLEYFCNEGDDFWTMKDLDLVKLALKEVRKSKNSPEAIGLIDCEILDYHVERVRNAYPAYFDTYSEFDKVRQYLDSIEGLYCIGRNGQHRYNNMDHSMCTAFEAVHNIETGNRDNSNIWNVNTEQEYHEEK